jgi:hypothetical protein
MVSKPLSTLILSVGTLLAAATAQAEVFAGVEFPSGSISFADKVISFNPSFSGGAVATLPGYLDPENAVGTPNWPAAGNSVSLGSGGQIVLQFTNNFLTGSNSSALDLHIFEIGPDVEDTWVDISEDGIAWESIGKVFGSIDSIDIDAFGFGADRFFSFVRLTDDPNEGLNSGATVGADIDAVGAISTVINHGVPDAGATALLLGVSLVGLAGLRRRFAASV